MKSIEMKICYTEGYKVGVKETEKRMLRFAEWFGFDCMDEDKNLPNFNTAKEAFQFWKDNVEGEK